MTSMTNSAHVFGDAQVHPITGRHIENGIGALPEHVQVEQHIRAFEATAGKTAADEMRRRLKQFERVTKHEGTEQ